MSEWQVEIDHDFSKRSYIIYVVRDVSGGEEWMTAGGRTTEVVTEGGTPVDAAFATIPASAMGQVISGLIQAADREGYKAKDKSFVEGKLEATERHLEDMRVLMKVRSK